jgi:3-keto-L-gulonate-6-phosphate decarboxylase
MYIVTISWDLLVDVCWKWAKYKHVMQQSSSWKLVIVHKNMDTEFRGENWCRENDTRMHAHTHTLELPDVMAVLYTLLIVSPC